MFLPRWLVVTLLTALLAAGPTLAADQDSDGYEDDVDNCPLIPNPEQDDTDSDAVGDVCDSCPHEPNPDQVPRLISHEPLHQWTRFASMSFTHDETRVVYRHTYQENYIYELFAAPWDGSAPPIDLSQLEPYREAVSYEVSADELWVVYSADREVMDEFHLYSVPLAGGTSTRLDVDPLVRPVASSWYVLSADSDEVFFVAEHPDVPEVQQAFRVPIAGGTPKMIDTWTAIGLSADRLALAAGGSRLMIWGDDYQPHARLGSVRLSDESAVLLGESSLNSSLDRYKLTADENHVVMQITDVDDRLECVPVDGSAPPVLLNTPGEEVLAFDVTPRPVDGDYRVVWATQGEGMFSNRLDGTDRRTVSAQIADNEEWEGYEFPPDGDEVVFHDGGVFVASVLGEGERTLSNLDAEEIRLAPDGSRVFFEFVDYNYYPEQYQLWSAPFDGSAPALRHDGTLPTGRGVAWWLPSPTSDGVFYSATFPDGGGLRIYWSPATLPGWVELSEQGRAGSRIAVASDGRRIVYQDSVPDVVITPTSLYARALEPDQDQDGLVEPCDCNDLDPFQLPPAVMVDSLRLAEDLGVTGLSWEAPEGIGLGDRFTVLRADAPDAYTVGGTIDCLAGPSAEFEAFDADPAAPGAIFAYLIRVDNGCGTGPLPFDRTAGESHVCP